jgi:hypothetical protein
MKCFDCEFDNPEEEKWCLACGAPLADRRPSLEIDYEATRGRYNQFKNASEMARSGQWTPVQFSKFMEDISAFLAKKSQEIMELIQTTNYVQDGGADEVQVGLSGIEIFERGMEEMYHYSQDQESEHLEQGLRMIWEGNQLILEAMRINRENRRLLIEQWDQFQQFS